MIRATVLLCLLCLLPGLALAQVAVNPGALDSLNPAPSAAAPAEAESSPAPAAKRAVRHAPPRKPAAPAAAKPTAKPQPPVALAPAPPPAPALAPAVQATVPRTVPAPIIPLSADALGGVAALPGGLQVTFGEGKADLNEATAGALHGLGKQLAAGGTGGVNVYAYAAGPPDDPSTPRRLSLSRALAVRAVLMDEGVASTRIYLRALGNTASPGPPDRVDVQQVGAPAAGAPPAVP